MPRKILDASFVRQNPHAVSAMGYEALARYLAHDGPSTRPKIVTPREAAEIKTAGLGLVLVWEQGATDATWDAAEANRQADALGFPADRPIYYAEDVDVPSSSYPSVAGKLRGLTGRPKGIYGESGLVEHCVSTGAAVTGWIAASSAWSRDAAPSAALRQLVSNLVPGADENLILADDYGQWPAPTAAHPTPEVPMLTMVIPKDYPDGKPHPHRGEIWVCEGITASHVSSPHMVTVYQYIGVAGPTEIEAEWFDNLALLPNSIDPSTTFPRV